MNIEFNEAERQNIHYSGSYKVKNTPDVNLGGPASGPCNGFSGGLGISGPGFAVGANASTVDYGCEQREAARIAAMIGRMDIANMILEDMQVVKKAMANKKAREQAAAPATQEVVYTDPIVRRRMGLPPLECQQVAGQ